MWEDRLGRWRRHGLVFGSSIWADRRKPTDCGRPSSRKKGSTSDVAGCVLLAMGWARASGIISRALSGDAGLRRRHHRLLLTRRLRGWGWIAWRRTWKKATPLRSTFCRSSDSNTSGGKKFPSVAGSSISMRWREANGKGVAGRDLRHDINNFRAIVAHVFLWKSSEARLLMCGRVVDELQFRQ